MTLISNLAFMLALWRVSRHASPAISIVQCFRHMKSSQGLELRISWLTRKAFGNISFPQSSVLPLLGSSPKLTSLPFQLMIQENTAIQWTLLDGELESIVDMHFYVISIYWSFILCIRVNGVHVTYHIYVEVRRQLVGAGYLLPPCGSWGWNSGHWVWRKGT